MEAKPRAAGEGEDASKWGTTAPLPKTSVPEPPVHRKVCVAFTFLFSFIKEKKDKAPAADKTADKKTDKEKKVALNDLFKIKDDRQQQDRRQRGRRDEPQHREAPKPSQLPPSAQDFPALAGRRAPAPTPSTSAPASAPVAVAPAPVATAN